MYRSPQPYSRMHKEHCQAIRRKGALWGVWAGLAADICSTLIFIHKLAPSVISSDERVPILIFMSIVFAVPSTLFMACVGWLIGWRFSKYLPLLSIEGALLISVLISSLIVYSSCALLLIFTLENPLTIQLFLELGLIVTPYSISGVLLGYFLHKRVYRSSHV